MTNTHPRTMPQSTGAGDRAAFTLIEVIFCMAIFAIGFLTVALMIPAGTQLQRNLSSASCNWPKALESMASSLRQTKSSPSAAQCRVPTFSS